MSDFGAGPRLTQDLDFAVTTTGDIETVSGLDELQKDVAFQLLIELGPITGGPKSQDTKAVISSRTRRVLNTEPRIDTILSIDVTLLDNEDEAEIVAEVNADNSEQELVFSI